MIKQGLSIAVIVTAAVLLAAAVFFNAESGADTPPKSVATVATNPQDPESAPPQTVIGASATNTSRSKAVFDVQGMSCSGCINEIKSSLAGIEGIDDVLVDLQGGKVEVYYDPEQLSDVGRIAAAITAVGYPATLERTLTADEIEKEDSALASRSKLYIAAVGDWEISRMDYTTELTHARNRYENVYGQDVFSGEPGGELLRGLKAQVVTRLINEGIQMQEVRKSGFDLPPEALKKEFDQFLSQKGMTLETFKRTLAKTGYSFTYFMKKFENRVTIDRYVSEKVLSEFSSDIEKQQQYADWFNNASILAQVVYYDKELEAIAKSTAAGSGCGSSCTRS
jgi:copper chaperone CopZ